MRDINNNKFNTVKHAMAALTKPLDSVFKK